ncbi:unnamed protein product [Adineta steineri]|uniref:Biotin-protein ligase N-terminal domain-containing protein n=1 Tax=Adineta steineri TaxID=433720 RepID=A0A814S0B4_9BILA|nr:unnamed protein product [Adineta steineri]CAF4127359.1 unnamed protein product [Adineta steineri]
MRAFIFTTNKANAVHLISLFNTEKIPYVTSADITQLTIDYDVIIVPGGIAALYQKHLGEEGIASIRDFVANGGGYLGLCAGAYLASTNDITGTKNIGIGLLPVRYSLYGSSANIRANVTLNDANTNVIFTTSYHNGAVYQFDQLSTNVTVLATITDTDSSNSKFHEFLVNKATIIAGMFGKGHVVLCGPHIEVNMKSYMFSLIMEIIRQPEATISKDLTTLQMTEIEFDLEKCHIHTQI